MKFNELEIKQEIINAVEAKGFESMTDIQAESIPIALEGQDILGQAQTGTGKTAAFVIPILDKIEMISTDLQALILVPTRELALQVHKEVQALGGKLNVKSLAVFGGDPIDRQIQKLKEKPQVVVGTPGRCIDLINRKKLKIHAVKFFCLDEVDEMLNMGFIEDVEFISQTMPKQKQTLLFSATLPDKIKNIANKYQNNPKVIKVKSKSITADRVEQSYMIVKQKQKLLVLKNLIDLNRSEKIIIFTQTKRSSDEVADFLLKQGLLIGKIHGDLPQKTRTLTIQKFRDNHLSYLVATDVVARGIDIDNINLVINYELPQDVEYYIHRIGRTARGIDAKGRAITLVSPNVYDREFRHYERQLKIKIKEEKKPELQDVIKILKEKAYNQIVEDKSEAETVFKELAQKLASEIDTENLLAKLLEKAYPELSKKETLKLMESSNSGDQRSEGGGRGGRKSNNDRGRFGKNSGKRSGSQRSNGYNRDKNKDSRNRPNKKASTKY